MSEIRRNKHNCATGASTPCQITRCQPHSLLLRGELGWLGPILGLDKSKIYPRREDDDFDSLGADLPISVRLGYGGRALMGGG